MRLSEGETVTEALATTTGISKFPCVGRRFKMEMAC